MDVTLLGTGSALPTGDRYQAGLLVDGATSDHPFLVDCGAGTIHRIAQADYDVTDIQTLILTHHHLDHVADIPSLLKARWLRDNPTFTVLGPPGTRDYLEPSLSLDSLEDRVDMTIREIDDDGFAFAGHDVTTCATTHSAAGYAYRFDDALTISGDTEASPNVAALADGSSVLLHDCAYPDEDHTNHATPRALGRTLADTDVDRIYLTHLYPEAAAEAETMRRTVSDHVDATVSVASDLETLSIPASS